MAGITKKERERRVRAGYIPTKKRDRKPKKPTAEEMRDAFHDIGLLVMAADIQADKRKMAAIDAYLVNAIRVAAGGGGVG